MKIYVKMLRGTHFEIEVQPQDSVADVKKKIETVQGADLYPAAQQMLIHSGKVLTDSTTLEENRVADSSFVVIMLTKSKVTASGGSTTSASPASNVPPASSLPPPVQPSTAPAAPPQSAPESTPVSAPTSTPTPIPLPAYHSVAEALEYGEAASNLVSGSTLETTVQQIIDMGGGVWDRDTVLRALRAAFNNPERAVEYLYSGIPEQAEIPPVAQAPVARQAVNAPAQTPQADVLPSSGPNANPLDLFPQGVPNVGSNASAGNLDFLRNSQQFQALRDMVQANPQILQPMLQELGKQNPNLMRLIQEHQSDFLRLINEPVEGGGNIPAGAMPQTVSVTPEEREAIERLEAMGFERNLVLEVYFACNKNEELAANYLLDHINDFEE